MKLLFLTAAHHPHPMKISFSSLLIVAVVVGLGLGILAIYEWQQPRVLYEVVWEAPHKRTKSNSTASWFVHPPQQVDSPALSLGALLNYSCERIDEPDGTSALKVTWKGTTPLGGPTIASLLPKLTPGAHYALVGAIRRQNIDSGCRIEMVSLTFSGIRIKEGHRAGESFFEMDRNTDWQPFTLLVDESKVDFNLSGFLVDLQLDGPNTIYLRNLKFVQYPSGTNPLATSSIIEMGHFNSSVGVGIVVVLLVSGSALFVVMYQRRRARELRRIASLDG